MLVNKPDDNLDIESKSAFG